MYNTDLSHTLYFYMTLEHRNFLKLCITLIITDNLEYNIDSELNFSNLLPIICILCIRHSSIVKPFIIIHPNFNSPPGVSETGIQKKKPLESSGKSMMDDDDDDDNNDDHKNDDDREKDDDYKINVCETSSAFISYPCYSYQGFTVMHLLIESTGAHLG